MKAPFNFGGGGGSGSDDCTAESYDVIETETAIYHGSDDEPEYGTMKEYSGKTVSASSSLDSSNNYFQMTVPAEGRYDTQSRLQDSYSNIVSTVNINANKIATGNTILGISGTYTGLGGATTSQVLSGATFSTSSLSNASGTMTNVASIDPAKSVSLSNGTLYCGMTSGAHITNASSNYPEVSVPQDTLASTIGLTADKIVAGNTILGITGTGVAIGSPSSGDLYYYGEQVKSLVTGSTIFGQSQYGYITIGPGYLCFYLLRGKSDSSISGSYTFGFSTAVDLSQYSVFHVRLQPVSWQGQYRSSSETDEFGNMQVSFVRANSAPASSASSVSTSTVTYAPSSNAYKVEELTWDISDITSTQYIGVRLRNYSTIGSLTAPNPRSILIDRVWLT